MTESQSFQTSHGFGHNPDDQLTAALLALGTLKCMPEGYDFRAYAASALDGIAMIANGVLDE